MVYLEHNKKKASERVAYNKEQEKIFCPDCVRILKKKLNQRVLPKKRLYANGFPKEFFKKFSEVIFYEKLVFCLCYGKLT